jgi:hypothetical protein
MMAQQINPVSDIAISDKLDRSLCDLCDAFELTDNQQPRRYFWSEMTRIFPTVTSLFANKNNYTKPQYRCGPQVGVIRTLASHGFWWPIVAYAIVQVLSSMKGGPWKRLAAPFVDFISGYHYNNEQRTWLAVSNEYPASSGSSSSTHHDVGQVHGEHT